MYRIARFIVPHPANNSNMADRGIPQLLGAGACALVCLVTSSACIDGLWHSNMPIVFIACVIIALASLIGCVVFIKRLLKKESEFTDTATETVNEAVKRELAGIVSPDVSEWAQREIMLSLYRRKNSMPGYLGENGNPSYILRLQMSHVGDDDEIEVEVFSDQNVDADAGATEL